MIITKAQRDEVARGKRKTVRVKAHERQLLTRSPDGRKYKTIEDFAVRYLRQLERHGMTVADRRNIERLIDLLNDVLEARAVA